MGDAEYASFVATNVAAYAADKAAAGQWPREPSLDLSRTALDELHPTEAPSSK
jgi:hypothetical protein